MIVVYIPTTHDIWGNMKHNQYKSADASSDLNSEIRSRIYEDLQRNLDKFKDPVVIGELTFQLLRERESTNRILKNLLQKIEKLEAEVDKLRRGANVGETSSLPSGHDGVDIDTPARMVRSTIGGVSSNELYDLLPDVDKRIVDYVRKRRKVTAEDVRKALRYKGKNAASARLNHLYQMGLLSKRQSGRKVYFFINGSK